jgi:integrase
MKKGFRYVSSFLDRHGKRRYRFRRLGYAAHYFQAPFGTKEFEREYASCLSAEPAPIGIVRTKPGSVADVISRYYSDNAFLDLRPATQGVYMGVLERFRATFGGDPIRQFDAERVARLMTAMRSKPHAAARLRKLLARLFMIARRARLVPEGFDPIRDAPPPKATTKGYHRWTETELTAFEFRHPLGTKPRLAFALLLYGAQRSGDVRFMTHEGIAGGRIQLDQSKTNNAIDVPIVQFLQEALDAGPLGKMLLLETRDGEAFTPKGFYGMMKKACVKAGIPHCSPHGLRKSAAQRCRLAKCSDEEGMAITGHKSVSEYRRYAGEDSRGDLADAGMDKVMANLAKRVATAAQQAVEGARQ